MKFFTKKNYLILFSLFTVSLFFLQTVGVSQICTGDGVRNWTCTEYLGVFKTLLLYGVALLSPIVVLLLFNSKVFEAWKKFAIWAVPVILVMVTALSSVETGGGIGGMVEQRMLAAAIIGLYAGYMIASVAIIGTSWWKSREQ